MFAVVILLLIAAATYFFFNQQKSTQTPEPEPIVQESKPEPPKKKPKAAPAKKQKPIKPVEFKHDDLVAVLKGHTDTVNSLELSQNGKYLVSASEDRSVIVWLVKAVGGKNTHGRTNVEQDRALGATISPDGKGIVLGLDFHNCCRLLKLDTDTLKVGKSGVADMPVPDDELTVTSISFGYSCRQRNTVKQQAVPWIAHLCEHPKNPGKPVIHVISVQGTRLEGSPVDCGLGNINSVKANGQFFGACGFGSQLKVYEVSDDKFVVKKCLSVSQTGQVYDFAFEQTHGAAWELGQKVITMTKSGLFVYQTDERSSSVKELQQIQFPDGLNADEFAKYRPQVEYAHPWVAITHKTSIYMLNIEDSSKNVTYDNVYLQVIKSLQLIPKHNLVLTSGGKFIKALKYSS